MPHVFVNGISAKSGGGRSILTNLLAVARSASDCYRFTVSIPSLDGYAHFASERVNLLPMEILSRTVMIPYASLVALPQFIRKLRPDIVFNLADVPIATDTRQIFLFDWPYAAFPDSPAWRLAGSFDRLSRQVKMVIFRWLLQYVDTLVAQNLILAEQLERLYGIKDIPIVSNAVSVDNLASGRDFDFRLGDGFKLLCLSAYYSHKNIEVFIPLAEKIRKSGLKIKIITTIESQQNKAAEAFLTTVRLRGLDDIVVNIGNVSMSNVPSIYKQTDALLLPTLLESFSGTYVEAMFHRKPILTSDLPFARGVCKDSAFYFNPLDESSIFNAILNVVNDPIERRKRQEIADQIFSEMPSWEEVYNSFTEIFNRNLDRHT